MADEQKAKRADAATNSGGQDAVVDRAGGRESTQLSSLPAQAQETKHGADCGCVRCTGFQPGHELATRHGAYSMKLTERATEIADYLRESMGTTWSPRFEIAVETAAAAGARYETAMRALLEAEPGQLQRLDQDARGWARLWFSILDKLGLTPLAASRQGLNLALGHDAAQRALERHVTETYDAARPKDGAV